MDELHDTILGSESWSLSDSLSKFINKETSFESPSEMWNEDYVSKKTIWQCKDYNTYINASNGILLSTNGDQNDNQKDNEPEICGWTIIVPKGFHLELKFWSFDIPVNNYFLNFRGII